MTAQDIAQALRRAEAVLQRKPGIGLHDDAPATARWDKDLTVISSHANGTEVATDMPRELGGGGERVTPGWLFRAGLASCVTTRIAMAAAAEGIGLSTLEILVSSRSDTRGVFGMAEPDGTVVGAGPVRVQMRVRIGAPGVSRERLQELVEYSYRCSPMLCAMESAVPVELNVEMTAP
jgi:uncharacterized OsmC-like protein